VLHRLIFNATKKDVFCASAYIIMLAHFGRDGVNIERNGCFALRFVLGDGLMRLCNW